MPIDVEHYRMRLSQIEGELLGDLARAENDARLVPSAEVQDETDLVVADEERDLALDESNRSFETLVQVKDALARVEAGTYGKCTVCGKDIEKKRLDAVPWTPYCLADAEAREPKFTPPTL